jgi:hypothetical protein
LDGTGGLKPAALEDLDDEVDIDIVWEITRANTKNSAKECGNLQWEPPTYCGRR